MSQIEPILRISSIVLDSKISKRGTAASSRAFKKPRHHNVVVKGVHNFKRSGGKTMTLDRLVRRNWGRNLGLNAPAGEIQPWELTTPTIEDFVVIAIACSSKTPKA